MTVYGVYLAVGAALAVIFALLATCTKTGRREAAVASAPWPVMALVIVVAWPLMILYTLARWKD